MPPSLPGVWLRTLRGFKRLVSSVGYLAGPAVVGQDLADLSPNPNVRVVAARLQGLDHIRDPGRGRAVGDGVDHVAADPWIGIPRQLEQPRPHPVVVGPDVAGAEVPARELASPALLAPGQLEQTVYGIPGCAPLGRRQADPCLLSHLAPPSHPPDDNAGRVPGLRIIPPAGGASDPEPHRVSWGFGQTDCHSRGRPAQAAHAGIRWQAESAGRRIRTCRSTMDSSALANLAAADVIGDRVQDGPQEPG
jgi:hypothetical protein